MFHLAKYMTEEVYVQPRHFSTQEGDNGGKNFLKCISGAESKCLEISVTLSLKLLYFVCYSQRASLSLLKTF